MAGLRVSVCLVGVVTLGAVAMGCGATQSTSPVITIDGSSTVFPITEAVAEEFQSVSPESRVLVGISGTGGGFSKFCARETDISDASRPITAVEAQTCAEAGIEFVELPVAYDGIAIVVNPNNDWVDALTVGELKQMWEPAAQDTVARWNQVRAEWPEAALHLFGPGTDSGTFDYFTDVIVGEQGASRGDFTSSEDDNVLVQGVSTDELALGFFGYAYFRENRDRIKIVPVDDNDDTNGAGPIAASPASVRDGTYQPLSRPVFIYVKKESLNRPGVAAFVDFYLEHASDLVTEVGYIPLNAREYDLVAERAHARVTGSMFSDKQRAKSLQELFVRLTSS